MSGLDAIDVKVGGLSVPSTDNVLSLLQEIRHAFQQLVSSGQPTTSNLSSMPLSRHDRNRLFETLGEGEVQGRGDAFRPTSIRETAFPGVWSVPHMNLHGAELSALVEIARLPSALITPERDLEDFAAALEHRLTA